LLFKNPVFRWKGKTLGRRKEKSSFSQPALCVILGMSDFSSCSPKESSDLECFSAGVGRRPAQPAGNPADRVAPVAGIQGSWWETENKT